MAVIVKDITFSWWSFMGSRLTTKDCFTKTSDKLSKDCFQQENKINKRKRKHARCRDDKSKTRTNKL